MNDFVHEAKRRENELLTKKKFKAADQTAAVSARGIAVGEGQPTAEIERKDSRARRRKSSQLDADVAAAKDYRIALETIVKEIQAPELDLEKQIAAIETELNALARKSRQVLDVTRRMDQPRSRARRALHRQHQARPDLVAGHEDQLQLQLGRPLRPLHRLPSRDRQDGARLGHGAGLPGDSARRARANRAAGRRPPKRRKLPTRTKKAEATTPPTPTLDVGLRHRARARRPGRPGRRHDSGRRARKAWPPWPACRWATSSRKSTAARSTRTTDVAHYLLDIAEWGKPIDAEDSPRPGSAVHVASAARSVRRQHEPAQEGRDGLHDLPRRAGQCDRFQVGLAHAERSAAGARLVAQIRLVRQSSLDFPDDARAVHREQLPEVPSRSRRAGAERAVPRAAGAEAGAKAITWCASTAATAATKSPATTARRSGSAPICAWSRISRKSRRRFSPTRA